jgi:hypothetical protein
MLVFEPTKLAMMLELTNAVLDAVVRDLGPKAK